jgi:hypothetical protein
MVQCGMVLKLPSLDALVALALVRPVEVGCQLLIVVLGLSYCSVSDLLKAVLHIESRLCEICSIF